MQLMVQRGRRDRGSRERSEAGGPKRVSALTLGAVQAGEALLAVTLARVAEAMAAAVAGAAPLAAVLRGEVCVALADAAHAHALPAAVPGAGGLPAVSALPALLAAAAAGLGREGSMAAAVAAQTCQGEGDE